MGMLAVGQPSSLEPRPKPLMTCHVVSSRVVGPRHCHPHLALVRLGRQIGVQHPSLHVASRLTDFRPAPPRTSTEMRNLPGRRISGRGE